MKPVVIYSHDFACDAADFIIEKAQIAIEARGRFILSLCGGKTPELVYAELAKRGVALDWSKIILTFGDERCVPSDHADSNYAMVKRSLLDRVQIPTENVLRIRGEDEPTKAASDYESKLKEIGAIEHDLILLGLGDDGHTASLFPGTAALGVTKLFVTPVFVPRLDSWRVTLTYKLINSARDICFLVNDRKKQPVVDEILSGGSSYPAARVSATESLTWIIGKLD